jgi:hypothetical protein
LDTLEWSNSHLIAGDSTAEITNLKRQPGKDIFPAALHWCGRLLRDGLLDELSPNILPVVDGSGMHLSDGKNGRVGLEFVEPKTFRTGALGVT